MSATRRFLIYLTLATLAATSAIYLRFTGWRPSPVLDAGVFSLAVLAAGFMLSWGAEAAERRVSQGLMLAGLALVTVLPNMPSTSITLSGRAKLPIPTTSTTLQQT